MEERFMKPAAAGIIEKIENGKRMILLQDREKAGAELEAGLCEIPAGKIREFENIYDCLRREIWEETGLIVTEIEGEEDSSWFESHGYRVLQYTPFASTQNTSETYPIMVQTFICKAEGELAIKTNETANLRWVEISELKKHLEEEVEGLYPMHVMTLKKYLAQVTESIGK